MICKRLIALRLSCVLALSALALAGGCRKTPPPPTPQITALPVNSFMRAWVTTPTADATAELHVRDELIFVYDKSLRVTALKRDSGLQQFSYDVKGSRVALHPPVVLKDQIAYPTATTLEVFAKDGKYLRSVKLPFANRTDGAGRGTFVFLAGDYPGGGSRMAKVNVLERYVAIDWAVMNVNGKAGFSAAPAVVEDAVYFGGMDGNVYALAAANRQVLWPTPNGVFHTGGAIEADLAADGSGIYVASTDGVLYALDRNNGRRRWQYFSAATLLEGPVATADRVYLRVPKKGMLAFHKTEGAYNREPLWTSTDVKQILSQDEKLVYVLDADNRIAARDKTTGEVKFKSKRDDFTLLGTNLKDDTIFAATRGGQVYAIKAVLKPGVVGEGI